MATKHYSNDEITVKWQSDRCIHSEKCFHGLKSVFNPNNRPWIAIDAESAKRIADQVDQCPSGALSYEYNLKQKDNTMETNQELIVETMPNGPLMVYSNLTVKHAGSEEVKDSKATAFCRCGASKNKPYCDGGHKKIDFKG